MKETNREGLTFEEWCDAAAVVPRWDYVRKWRAGEDPCEYRMGEEARHDQWVHDAYDREHDR